MRESSGRRQVRQGMVVERVGLAVTLAVFGGVGCASAPPRPVVRTAPVAPATSVDPLEAALTRALEEHRPATPPRLREGRLTLPDDWKTLPQAALERRITYRIEDEHALVVGDTIVAPAPEELLGIDLASGDVRWARPIRGELVRGCGVVVAVEPDVARGVDPATGAVVWERELPEGARRIDRRFDTTHGGCHLMLQSHDRHRAGVQRFAAIDTRDGALSELAECDRCEVASKSADGLVWTVRGQPSAHVSLDGTVTPLPEGSDHFVEGPGGPVAVLEERAVWRGVRPNGDEVWSREEPMELFARIDGWALMRERHALVRLELATGDVTWRLPLGPRLERSVSRYDVAYGGGRLVLATRAGHPCPLVEIDIESGAPLAFRVLPEMPRSAHVVGDRLVVGSESAIWVVDLEHEVAPLRDAIPFEQDVARGVERLFGPEADGPSLVYGYPQGRRQAMGWLRSLGPLARPALLARVETATLSECVRIAAALRGAPAADLVPLLRRSLVPLTEEGAVALRRTVAGSLPQGTILPPELGPPLAANAVEWLATARAEGDLTAERYELCRSREMMDTAQCTRQYEVALALGSTRGLLETAFASAAPLRALRAAIAHGQPPPDPCTPSGEDAVRLAALTHDLELEVRPVGAAIAEGAGCVPLMTHRGPVTVASEASGPPAPWWRIGPVLPVDERPVQWNDPVWDSAPMRRVELRFHGGPRDGAGADVYLIELDGLWRVVFVRRRWVS